MHERTHTTVGPPSPGVTGGHAARPGIAGHGHEPVGPVPTVLLGGGGHALVVLEAAALAGVPIGGFLDDNPAAPVSAILIDLPHPFATPRHLGKLLGLEMIEGFHWVVALGDVRHRRRVLRAIGQRSVGPLVGAASGTAMLQMARSVIHPRAYVSPTAVVGAGSYVGPCAVVHSRARIGAHAIINTSCVVEHDCVVGENTHIAPGAALGGGVHVGADTLVGLGARILPGVRIGRDCVIGGGSVVTHSIEDGRTVMGVPAT